MKITYDEATDIIYSELRNCENSIAKKLGLKEVDVDIIGDCGCGGNSAMEYEESLLDELYDVEAELKLHGVNF